MHSRPSLRRTLLCATVAASLSGLAHGQATTGRISGQAPVAAGETVLIEGSNGLTREVGVDKAAVAKLEDGVLRLTLPKRAGSGRKLLAIQ